MEVGFEVGFMIRHLRQIAQHLFGKRLSDEMQALRHKIVLLQDSLAVLATYKEEMKSTGATVPKLEHSRSCLFTHVRPKIAQALEFAVETHLITKFTRLLMDFCEFPYCLL